MFVLVIIKICKSVRADLSMNMPQHCGYRTDRGLRGNIRDSHQLSITSISIAGYPLFFDSKARARRRIPKNAASRSIRPSNRHTNPRKEGGTFVLRRVADARDSSNFPLFVLSSICFVNFVGASRLFFIKQSRPGKIEQPTQEEYPMNMPLLRPPVTLRVRTFLEHRTV